jgi:adenosine kinase
VVDPTGCGDAYRAGLLYGRAQGLDLDAACRIGSLMGALKVSVEGPQGLDLESGAFAERYAAEFGAPLP